MPRKPNTSADGYNEILPKRLRGLFDTHREETQQRLADNIGVSRQMVSQYCNGVSAPDWKAIVKIAQYFDVSADYLLGLSDCPSIDANAKAAVEYTGLSPAAVDTLHSAIRNKPQNEAGELFSSGVASDIKGFVFLDNLLSRGDAAAESINSIEWALHGAILAQEDILLYDVGNVMKYTNMVNVDIYNLHLFSACEAFRAEFAAIVEDCAKEHNRTDDVERIKHI